MPTDPLLTPREASKALGVHLQTLRKWEAKGVIEVVRTPGGHRRFKQSVIDAFRGDSQQESTEERAIIYCRVSSHDQKKSGDLERQVGRITAHCVGKNYKIVEVLEDVGSGMSDTRPKLKKLFKLVDRHQIDRVVVEHKDRLTRFGFGLLEAYFGSHGVVIEWTEEVLGKSYEDELVEDILTLMASFSAKIYGKRSAERRRKEKEKEKNAKSNSTTGT